MTPEKREIVLAAFRKACRGLKQLKPDYTQSKLTEDGIYRSVTFEELKQIAADRWIRPRTRNGTNPHMEVPQLGGALKKQDDRWYFKWHGFLLDVNKAEYSEKMDGTWHSITFRGEWVR